MMYQVLRLCNNIYIYINKRMVMNGEFGRMEKEVEMAYEGSQY